MKSKNNIKFRTDEEKEIMRFIGILLVVLATVGIIYGISKIFINKEKTEEKVVEGIIDYSRVNVGTMFNRMENEYYVMAYNVEDSKAMYYSTLVNKYLMKEKSLKIYYCDTANILNKDYIANKGEKSNPKAKNMNDLKLGKFTLLKIKNKKIVKYMESIEDVKKELGI